MLSDAFLKLKANLEPNPSFADTVSQKYNAVKNKMENGRRGTSVKLIGSLQRRTRIQPKPGSDFDIDILVQLGDFQRWVPANEGISSEQALGEIHSIVHTSERYGAMSPTVSSPTVEFEYRDGVKVQLVPAYLDNIGHSPDGTVHQPVGRAFWVPKEGGGWKLADYDHDADYITSQNTLSGGWLIPIVKMLKVLRREYFPKMSPYYLEILAAQYIPRITKIYNDMRIPLTFNSLIADFFKVVDGRAGESAKIPGSHTPAIVLSSIDAEEVNKMLKSIQRYCETANKFTTEGDKKKSWRELFGDPFPSI